MSKQIIEMIKVEVVDAKGGYKIVDQKGRDEQTNYKYYLGGGITTLLLAIAFTILYNVSSPSLVFLNGVKQQYEQVSTNCIYNNEITKSGDKKSEGGCYTQWTEFEVTTHSQNQTHVIQNFQITNLTKSSENGTVVNLITFMGKNRLLEVQKNNQTEMGLEHINRIGNGKIILDIRTGAVTGMYLPKDTDPNVAQAIMQMLHNTHPGFIEGETPEVAKNSITSHVGQANNQIIETSSIQYYAGTKTLKRESVPEKDGDLQLHLESIFKQNGQLSKSILKASRLITHKSENSTISIECQTSQSTIALSEEIALEEDINYQQQLHKLQNLVFYDSNNISLVSASQETKDKLIKLEQSKEAQEEEEVPNENGGRLLQDIMAGRILLLSVPDHSFQEQTIYNTLIEQKVDINTWKLQTKDLYCISMIVKEYVNGKFSAILQRVDNLIINISNYERNYKSEVIQRIVAEIPYSVGGIQMEVVLWSELQKESYVNFHIDPTTKVGVVYLALEYTSRISGISSFPSQTGEQGIGVDGIQSYSLLHGDVYFQPTFYYATLNKVYTYNYSVYGFTKEAKCTPQSSVIQWCQPTCDSITASYQQCSYSPLKKTFENNYISVQPYWVLAARGVDFPY